MSIEVFNEQNLILMDEIRYIGLVAKKLHDVGLEKLAKELWTIENNLESIRGKLVKNVNEELSQHLKNAEESLAETLIKVCGRFCHQF